MIKDIILYHGTRASPTSIRELGLIAGGLDRTVKDPLTEKYIVNKERTLQRVLDEFGLKKDDIPPWVYQGELDYEKDEPIHIHFEISLDNATGYADMGGEPAYVMRNHIMNWLDMKRLGDIETCLWAQGEEGKRLHKENNRRAKLVNGEKTYVVVVKLSLDDGRMDTRAKQTLWRMYKAYEDGLVGKSVFNHAYEVRYYGDIAPEDILGIVQVEHQGL